MPSTASAGQEPYDAELPGLSAFAASDGVVYHTYSCYARGLDAINSAYQLLDRAPKDAARTTCRTRWHGYAATTNTTGGPPERRPESKGA